MGNPFGIALDPTWTKWAAKQGVSETIAAAVYLISKSRKAGEVVVQLNSDEVAQVIHIIGHQPDRFPQGTLAAPKGSRLTPPGAAVAGRNPYGITVRANFGGGRDLGRTWSGGTPSPT